MGERANLKGLVRGAVSKPNVASKYAFESSRRDLHNALRYQKSQSGLMTVFMSLAKLINTGLSKQLADAHPVRRLQLLPMVIHRSIVHLRLALAPLLSEPKTRKTKKNHKAILKKLSGVRKLTTFYLAKIKCGR